VEGGSKAIKKSPLGGDTGGGGFEDHCGRHCTNSQMAQDNQICEFKTAHHAGDGWLELRERKSASWAALDVCGGQPPKKRGVRAVGLPHIAAEKRRRRNCATKTLKRKP